SPEVRVAPLDASVSPISIPLIFDADCRQRETLEAFCPPVPPGTRVLNGPPDASSPDATQSFTAMINVPTAFTDGFAVMLPRVTYGGSEVEARPFKFKLRNGVLLKGVGGC